MKIAITGANGFIGQKLTDFLIKKGFEVKGISRFLICGNLNELAASLAGADAVIHLSGAPVMQRWTKKNKRIIYNSRIVTTWNLTKAMNLLTADRKPEVFISISAVGVYAPGKQHDEQSQYLNGEFLGKVVTDWENASTDMDRNIRRVTFRSGVVLGKDSRVIKNMLPLFKMGLGGKIGNGRQPFPFIHIDDLAQAFYESIVNKKFYGAYNLVAPDQVTNELFTSLLSRYLHKPAFFHVPALVLKIVYGKASVMLLENPSVTPQRLTAMGFPYQYPTLETAIKEILLE
jgi:hypothetical protein